MLTDQEMDREMGSFLRAGVVTACGIMLVGAVLYLIRHGGEHSSYRTFHGQPAPLESVRGIVGQVREGSARGIIQLGVLAMIATPVMRVAFAVYGFARQKDRMFVGISLTVLALLACGLFLLK